mmetsp:Transcript_12965/g.28420  ORF Transcript_12965/g.28420 Transcript_12965/m.28420 type:complete len:168 (+) Transcript_12965:95-598(+)|eukprot:CAMPEP_0168783806 /NCGR_PEP_ID=MMETSP0725-20121227/9887_1 /TAXON_ID=265536 /ORGANISM="Amphiprora sp., Strain CCMP467" /LENGTH=167 /DNA_ID=CAMNT_0008833817 /DNA_START=38 /DNA_END=541 /DNA_ORIENTATION=-
MSLDVSDPAIQETWEKMANPSESLNWFMLNYVDKSKLQVKSSGDGGLAELAGKFEDDQVMFGFLKVGAEDRKAVTSTRQKLCMITWIGEGVGIMKKAKVGPQRQELINSIQGIQFFLQASEQSDVDMGHLASEILRSGGAHKPTHYIFGPGQEVALADMGSNFKTYV